MVLPIDNTKDFDTREVVQRNISGTLMKNPLKFLCKSFRDGKRRIAIDRDIHINGKIVVTFGDALRKKHNEHKEGEETDERNISEVRPRC